MHFTWQMSELKRAHLGDSSLYAESNGVGFMVMQINYNEKRPKAA
jgi:hypothetical protein